MNEEDALAALGIHVDAEPRLRNECVRIARRLRLGGRKIVGLFPTASSLAIPPIAVHLGLALAEVSGGTVAFVDANLRWPGLSKIVGGEQAPEGAAFATRWLRGSLALLTPPQRGAAGAGVVELAHLIQQGAELFAHVLVDLTGFKQLGEHLSAIEMIDGVVIVARSGRTTEDELLRLKHELPRAQNLGVLLLGR
jgi:hypothetical protein